MVDTIARATGLVRRNARKLFPRPLLQALCLTALGHSNSCRDLALAMALKTGKVPSRQAVWARLLRGPGRRFVEAVLAAFLGQRVRPAANPGGFRHFRRVLVQDSSVLSLPGKLREHFSGVSNGLIQSCQTRVQAVYDLLAENFVTFRIDPYSRNDLKATEDILEFLQPGDLVLRDMGYFKFTTFAAIARRGAYYLSRLKPDCLLLDPETEQRIDLLAMLRQRRRFDGPMLLGKDAKLPIRLIAEPVPQEVGDARRRKRPVQNKRTRYTPETLALMDWSIYLTNIPAEWLDAAQLLAIYALRWRIESIFKVWKSYLNFTRFPDMTLDKLYLTLSCRLLAVTIFHRILVPAFTDHPGSPGRQSDTPGLSLQLLGKLFARLLQAIPGKHLTETFLEEILGRLCRHDRRQRQNFAEQLQELFNYTSPPPLGVLS